MHVDEENQSIIADCTFVILKIHVNSLRKPRSTFSCFEACVSIVGPFSVINSMLLLEWMFLDEICNFGRTEITEPEAIKNLMLLLLSRMCKRFSLLQAMLFTNLPLLLLCEELPNLM